MAEKTKDVPGIIKEYLNYLEVIQEMSRGTVYLYKINLKIFVEFLKTTDKFKDKDFNEDLIREIELNDLYDFLNYIKNDRGNSPASRANKIATLKSFFKYCTEKAKIIQVNPCSELEAPRQGKRQVNYLTLEESQKLLESIDSRNYERDFCIATIFLNCGLRLSELCNIKLTDIKKDTLVVRGKGNKDRTVYLNESCLSAIKQYKEVRKKVKSKYLFLSERDNPISKRQVEYIIQHSIEAAGLDTEKYTTHKLRHTAATLLHKYADVDIRTLQEILGHKNISTTTIYTHVDDDTIRQAVKANPLNIRKK